MFANLGDIMIKKIIALILFVSINVFAGDCGKVTKLSFSPDHGGLVGLSMRLDDTKVRVTINNSPDLIGHVQATIDKIGENHHQNGLRSDFTPPSNQNRSKRNAFVHHEHG